MRIKNPSEGEAGHLTDVCDRPLIYVGDEYLNVWPTDFCERYNAGIVPHSWRIKVTGSADGESNAKTFYIIYESEESFFEEDIIFDSQEE